MKLAHWFAALVALIALGTLGACSDDDFGRDGFTYDLAVNVDASGGATD
jgi:hypothetical protein